MYRPKGHSQFYNWRRPEPHWAEYLSRVLRCLPTSLAPSVKLAAMRRSLFRRAFGLFGSPCSQECRVASGNSEKGESPPFAILIATPVTRPMISAS